MDYGMCLSFFAAFFMLASQIKGVTFSRSHTAVWFDPFVTSTESLRTTAYDINGLIPMISKIASKFDKIVVGNMGRLPRRPNSHELIAPAVATFNKFQLKPPQHPMTVMMVFNLTEPSEFALTKKLADKANLIYNGTVQSLYFDYPDLLDETVSAAEGYLANIQNLLKDTEYELGARFPIEDCRASYIKPILQYIRQILFYRFPTNEDLIEGPKGVFSGFSNEFEDCISSTSSKSENREISVGFESGWFYSPGTEAANNNRDLVKFWEKMENLAVENNFTVVLSEAFDTPWKKDQFKLKYWQGWWRLIENPLYYHSSQYVFEDKGMINRSNPYISHTTPTFLVGSPQGRDNTVVWLEPRTLNMGGNDGLPIIISTISSKFSRVVLGKIDPYNNANPQSLVVSAIAKFNNGTQPTGPRIEALLTFSFDPKTPMSLRSRDLNNIRKLADQANNISAGTVIRFYLEADNFGNESVEGIQRNLNIIQNSLKNTSYELGARLHVSHCHEGNLSTVLFTLLPFVRQIIFYHHQINENLQDGADELVPNLTRFFTRCLINMRETNDSISVVFQSGWAFHTGSTREGNTKNVVKFWDKMTNWAVLSNLSLVLEEALDNPSKHPVGNQRGWWRLINNSSHHVIEEKDTGIQLHLGTPQLPQKSTETPLTTSLTTVSMTTEEEIETTPQETASDEELSTTTPKEPVSKTPKTNTDSSTFPPKFPSTFTNKPAIPSSPTQPSTSTTMQPRTTTLQPVVSTAPPGLDMMSIVLMIFGITLLLFALVLVAAVVFCRPKRQASSTEGRSLEEEIKEFHNGAEDTIGEGDYIPGIRNMRYNKNLEISKTAFKIDKNATLGSGAFGAVYRGSVRKEEEIQVAIKTTKIPSPTTAISALLSEIKVMSYIGQHENIVSMIGAYTKEVKTGKIYVFLELCSLGSLEKYLRRNISTFTNAQRKVSQGNIANVGNCYEDFQVRVNVNTPGESNHYENTVVECVKTPTYMNMDREDECPEAKKVSTAPDLYRWACEIANGMEYLASKSVVHADLATRNVLLTMDRTAKISDFGLSRRLYEYTNYVKTKQEPLPWRWMAPESLRRMEFNEKTDVWGFGVTLWEIYSLGDIPFEGLSWTPDFSKKLEDGLCLPAPSYCDHKMYERMQWCCNVDANARPTFAELKKTLV